MDASESRNPKSLQVGGYDSDFRLPGSKPGLLTVARDGPQFKIYRISVFNIRTTELKYDTIKKREEFHPFSITIGNMRRTAYLKEWELKKISHKTCNFFLASFLLFWKKPRPMGSVKFFVRDTDFSFMIAELDFYFPFIVLFYGCIMTVVTHLPLLREEASRTLSPELVNWFYGHRIMGTVCLFVGAMWSLQRLFI